MSTAVTTRNHSGYPGSPPYLPERVQQRYPRSDPTGAPAAVEQAGRHGELRDRDGHRDKAPGAPVPEDVAGGSRVAGGVREQVDGGPEVEAGGKGQRAGHQNDQPPDAPVPRDVRGG